MKVEDKLALDQLQAEVTRQQGRRITQEELLGRLVELGRAELRRLAAAARPASAQEIRTVMSFPLAGGRRTREEDIDRDVYGLRR